MTDENDHTACVDAWLERAGAGVPADGLVRLFEQGFSAIWQRAHQTLGDVTLGAIVDRVLSTAAEQFPLFTCLAIETTGIRFQELRERAGSVHHEQLAEGLRFVLVELLTVLGNLTAEILTPALHAALSKVAPQESGPDGEASRGEPRNPGSNGEGAKP